MRKPVIVCVGAFLAAFLLGSCTQKQIYYLDSASGNDDNNGRSPAQAWKSLGKLNRTVLQAGDEILLKRGKVFSGTLELSAQGAPDARIVIGAYGEETDKPRIEAPDSSLYAVRILNSAYLTFRDIEIVNKGTAPMPRRAGLKIECYDYGTSEELVIDNVTVRDVNGSPVKREGAGCGIYVVNGGKQKTSTFDGLTIQNCHILRCTRNGMIWEAYYDRRNWHPSKRTVIRGNLIEGVPGDGIVPIGCDSTLIEYNVMRDCPDILPVTEASAGIWPWSCDNTIVRFNAVSDQKAAWDAQGYDSDYNCTNTVIEYNYSHDNFGGMVLICDSGSETDYSIGNRNTIVRYNISINDGKRDKPARNNKMFSPGIHVSGPVKNTRIEYNIVHLNRKTADSIDRSMYVADSWDGFPDSTFVRYNIFYTPEESSFNLSESTGNTFEENYYIGDFRGIPENRSNAAIQAIYREEVLQYDRDGYEGLYKLMDTKEIGGFQGRFVNKEKIENFFKRIK